MFYGLKSHQRDPNLAETSEIKLFLTRERSGIGNLVLGLYELGLLLFHPLMEAGGFS